ncbi:MAG: type II toxin-antitoxin system VapC family toxin [Rhodospirillaceae bacterium]
MAKCIRLYWDSCAWIGFLNGESDKKQELEILYTRASKGDYELWTSTLSLVEVRRIDKFEKYDSKPLSAQHAKTISDLFRQPFVKLIPLTVDIADLARELFRTVGGLQKWQDAIHLASALRWNADVLHTYDYVDLLHLNMRFECRNGEKLRICYPDETADGPLFAKQSK